MFKNKHISYLYTFDDEKSGLPIFKTYFKLSTFYLVYTIHVRLCNFVRYVQITGDLMRKLQNNY